MFQHGFVLPGWVNSLRHLFCMMFAREYMPPLATAVVVATAALTTPV